MKKQRVKTEMDGIIYHNLTMEAACVERRVNDPKLTSQRLAKLYVDAGTCWAAAAKRSLQFGETYAHRRFEFCKGALIRLGRHDLVEQLEAAM